MATRVKLDEQKGSLRTGIFDLHKKWLIEFSFDHLFCMPKGLSNPFDGIHSLKLHYLTTCRMHHPCFDIGRVRGNRCAIFLLKLELQACV